MGGAVKVYGVGASPFVATVLLCLEEVGADYELVPLDMAAREQRAEPHLSRNPFGKIPVLEDGALTLFESRAISRYVLRKFGSPGSKTTDLLRESSLEESAMVDVWTEVEAHQYQPAIANIVQQCVIIPFIGGARDQAVVDEYVGKLEKVLDVYEAQLSTHAYLAGDFFSLADLIHFGITYYLVAGTEYATLLESRASVWACWGRIMATPSVKKILKKCTHFEWMDDYIERIQFEGYIDSSGAATWELNLGRVPPIAVENLGSSDGRGAGRVLSMARYTRDAELHPQSELNEELKKINKHLMQMIDLQKQANIRAGGFYCCIIALVLFYLLFIRH